MIVGENNEQVGGFACKTRRFVVSKMKQASEALAMLRLALTKTTIGACRMAVPLGSALARIFQFSRTSVLTPFHKGGAR